MNISFKYYYIVFTRLIRNWVSCRITYKQQQSGNGNNRRTKQRRKSLEEQSITGIFQRLPKPSSVSNFCFLLLKKRLLFLIFFFPQQEDDAIKGASAINAEMLYQRLSKSAAHPSSSASTQIPQGGFSVKKVKNPSRRQLFTGV